MKLLYIDACAGLSGDMLAGALLDLGWPLNDLKEKVAALGLGGVKLEAKRVDHQGISALRLSVDDDADQATNHLPGHTHEPEHGHHHHHHHHHHRHLPDILDLLAKLPPKVGDMAVKVFRRLAEAEAKVHGKNIDEVHFHEVGAVDAIVDVTAFCAGLAWLGVERVICSPLPLARGFFKCAHGRLPLPPPAVLNLLEGAPLVDWPEEVETVTPTGAALVSSAAHEYGSLPAMRLDRVGIGGGSRQGGYAPNIVRLMLGETVPADFADQGQVVEIICHLDDMHPEDLPLAYERLMEAGALDVAASPLLMKKGRAGLALTVMARPRDAQNLAALVLEATTSLGVRIRPVGRMMLPRRMVEVETPWGPVPVKLAQTASGERSHVEADVVMRICREQGLKPEQVRQTVRSYLKKSKLPPAFGKRS
jgi:uncharacterized protein (TIGR00299 family) protein